MTSEEMVERIERDRSRREDGLALFLLALAERGRRYVNRAIRVGASWAMVLRGVFLGDETLDLPSGVPVLSRAMAETHHAGLARVGKLVGVPVAPTVPLEDLAGVYRPRATDALERIAGGLQGSVANALAEAVEADRIAADVRAVSEAFRTAGWAAEKPYAAQAEATAAVTSAYATGMGDGFRLPEVQAVMTGLRFVTVRDDNRTPICLARDGVTLPLNHEWWERNFCPLHWGCRSMALPLIGSGVRFTENPPEFPPPDHGWGRWAGMLTAFQNG